MINSTHPVYYVDEPMLSTWAAGSIAAGLVCLWCTVWWFIYRDGIKSADLKFAKVSVVCYAYTCFIAIVGSMTFFNLTTL